MPHYDEDAPRLAEIARTLTDFRHEFRTFTDQVVRKDVYTAHMATVQIQIDALAKEQRRLAEDQERGDQNLIQAIERDRTEKLTDRREVRKAVVTAGLSIVVAIVVLIIEIMIK